MSFSPRLVLSQSAPNLFSDWNDLERKFVSEKVKIEETFEMKKNQKCQNEEKPWTLRKSKTFQEKNILARNVELSGYTVQS